MGELEVLSVGRGDLKMHFEADNPEEMQKARKTIEDMLRRGYAIFVETDRLDKAGKPVLRRVKKFNSWRLEYIIAEIAPEDEAKPKPRKITERAIPIGKSKAHAVGRASGG